MRDDAGRRAEARDRETRLCVKGRGSVATELGSGQGAPLRHWPGGPQGQGAKAPPPRHRPPTPRGVKIFQYPSTVSKKTQWAVCLRLAYSAIVTLQFTLVLYTLIKQS